MIQQNAQQKRIYLDHNATTPVCAEVLASLAQLAEVWGNPSSIHWAGRAPKNLMRDARKFVAQSVNASPLEIVFTSGGTEANNTIIKGVYLYNQEHHPERMHFMCSQVEHPAVIRAMESLREHGARVDFIPVNRQGQIDMEFYKKHLSAQTALVSVMMANNETGTLFPVREMALLAHEHGALFHSDCVQAFGKIPVNLKSLNVDYASFSGHKFYSLKGSGFLFSKKGSPFVAFVEGGAQERHRRGGTENTIGIGALGIVAQRVDLIESKAKFLSQLRDYMEARILEEIPNVSITAGETSRLPNTSSLVLTGADGETMLMSLDIKGFAVSTGAACSSGNPEPSPTLLAMGLTRDEAQNSLRVSLGWENTQDEIDQFIENLKAVVARLRLLKDEGENCHV